MVNNPTQRDVPAFYSPLTHDQHAQIGRIAVLWGQVDMFVDNLLTQILEISPALRARLFSEKSIASKIALLSSFIQEMAEGEAKTESTKFAKMVNEAKSQRNKCFHGVWGYHVTRARKITPAAQHIKQVDQPFKVADLPKLERKLCQISHQGMLSLATLGVMPVFEGAQPMLHGFVADEEWFAEWRAQHHEDHQTPSRNWKPGRLPYLDPPLE